MEGNKLFIRSKKYRGDSMVISIRLTKELVGDIDKIAKRTGRTRNDIIQKSLEFALDNTEIINGNDQTDGSTEK